VESHLLEVGVTAEQFADICARASGGREVNKRVVEYLLAVDDFLSEWRPVCAGDGALS
jgi:hypothetical protein